LPPALLSRCLTRLRGIDRLGVGEAGAVPDRVRYALTEAETAAGSPSAIPASILTWPWRLRVQRPITCRPYPLACHPERSEGSVTQCSRPRSSGSFTSFRMTTCRIGPETSGTLHLILVVNLAQRTLVVVELSGVQHLDAGIVFAVEGGVGVGKDGRLNWVLARMTSTCAEPSVGGGEHGSPRCHPSLDHSAYSSNGID
jgi:hypothetical protein